MLRFVGFTLAALGVGHTLTGIILFRSALRDIWHNGVFNTIHPHLDRRLAFWFLIFSITLLMLGQLTLYADATQDKQLVRILGWHVLAIGAIGVVAMPRSPFWFALVVAPVLLRAGYVAG